MYMDLTTEFQNKQNKQKKQIERFTIIFGDFNTLLKVTGKTKKKVKY